ncbi:MAG: C25 family cysteine peptidase, partial [Candidatus Poseidoniales archaeon]
MSSDRPFRGMNKNEVLRSKIPISFRHQVMQGYDVLPQQLSLDRGSYLIIAREGLVQQGYVEVFAEFKKTQGFDVDIVSLTDSELDVNSVQNHITNHFTADPMLEYVLLIGDVDGFAEIPSY